MHRLYRIGGVDDLLHIVRVFEVGRQGGPLVAPGGDDKGIFVAPIVEVGEHAEPLMRAFLVRQL